MDAALQNQAHLVHGPVVGRQPDPIDTNQEDDFDFEIGGDDGGDLTGEADNESGVIRDQVGVIGDRNHQSDMYQPQEQEPQASVAEHHDDEGHQHGHEEVDTAQIEPESIIEGADLTLDAQTDIQTDPGVADQEEAEENIGAAIQEEIYYEETAEDFEDLDTILQPEPLEDHDLMNTATSVGHVHKEDDLQGRTPEADVDDKVTSNDVAQDFQLVPETTQNVETAENDDYKDDPQITIVAGGVENGDTRDDSASAGLAKNDVTDETGAESLDQSNWAENDDDDEDDSSATPIVTVSYRGQEYSMFAQAPEDDPDTYFLDGVDSIHQPLSQFLGNVREVISSEIEAGNELFARIDGLGLEFGESTTKDFLDQTTLAQIIEVNDRLSQNDGGSQHAELYIFLSVRSNPLQRFAELAKGAEEGQGLSYFEQYYEESPADVSLIDDEEHQGASQDIGSADLTPDGPYEETYEEPYDQRANDGARNTLNAQQHHNPFQVEDQQMLLNDTAISEILVAEAEPVENETNANTKETQLFDETVDGSADVGQQGDNDGFNLTSINEQVVSDEQTFGDAISVVDQVETEMGEEWGHDDGVEAQDELDVTEAGETTEEQAEVLINNSGEEHERTDDSTVNMTNDEDYLDLGDNAEDQAAPVDAEAADQFDIQQQTTPGSSATATLNGEENGRGDEAAATQHAADSHETLDPTTQNEDDEIDWNHDEDDIGDADQNPTDLSPSSLSVKRSRLEDEGTDGPGEDIAAKRRRT